MTSTALRLHAFGFENLRHDQLEVPAPGPGEVLVDLHAASLNFRDLMIVRGHYNPRMHLPRILGSDAAGTVAAIGEGVTQYKAGDRVTSQFFERWQAGPINDRGARSALGEATEGCFTTSRIFGEDALIPTPEHLTDFEAATLPCAALTAWNALIHQGHLRAGETVVTLGTGGVSLFALQIAKMHGATVIATSSSDQKLASVEALGADHLINYRNTPDWDKEILALTNGIGADHIIEVGGAGTLPHSLKAVRRNGHIYVIGALADPGKGIDIIPVLMKSINLIGVHVGSSEMFRAMNAAFTVNQIRPIIDRVFPFAEAHAALHHMASGNHFGKIILDLNKS